MLAQYVILGHENTEPHPLKLIIPQSVHADAGSLMNRMSKQTLESSSIWYNRFLLRISYSLLTNGNKVRRILKWTLPFKKFLFKISISYIGRRLAQCKYRN